MKRREHALLPAFIAAAGLMAAPQVALGSSLAPLAPQPPAGDRAPASESGAESVVEQARRLALDGRRTEAIALLDRYLQGAPGDTDARTLLGTVLSWEARYDEARRHLEQVLAEHPGHGDALPALINVEVWSGHPERAEALSRDATGRAAASNPRIAMGRARALLALGRPDAARDLLRRIARVDPSNDEARRLLSTLDDAGRHWRLTTTHVHDRFSDNRASWDETQIALERRTAAGPVLVRAARAARFGLTDTQVEIDLYPRLRAGTYAYVNAGMAPAETLYPGYRVGLEVYHSMGHGFEVSAGFRHLGFARGTTLCGGTLAKYEGDWMLSGRLDVECGSGRGAISAYVTARRAFGPTGRSHVSVRYGHGRTREDVRSVGDTLLDADTVAGDLTIEVGRRVEWIAAAGLSAGDRLPGGRLRQYSFRTGLGWRF